MSEHKGDELSATGSHRVWTGDTSGSAVRTGAPRDAQRNWLDRAHGAAPPSQPATGAKRAGGVGKPGVELPARSPALIGRSLAR